MFFEGFADELVKVALRSKTLQGALKEVLENQRSLTKKLRPRKLKSGKMAIPVTPEIERMRGLEKTIRKAIDQRAKKEYKPYLRRARRDWRKHGYEFEPHRMYDDL